MCTKCSRLILLVQGGRGKCTFILDTRCKRFVQELMDVIKRFGVREIGAAWLSA